MTSSLDTRHSKSHSMILSVLRRQTSIEPLRKANRTTLLELDQTQNERHDLESLRTNALIRDLQKASEALVGKFERLKIDIGRRRSSDDQATRSEIVLPELNGVLKSRFFTQVLLTQLILPVDAMRPQARTLMSFSLLVGALLLHAGDLPQALLTVGGERLPVEDLCHLLPVGAMRLHAETAVPPSLLVGAMLPHAGGDDADSTTRSVPFQSSCVIPPSVAPPPGISKREEYDLSSRARSHVKSRGESGTQSFAGNESFGEPTGSTPQRNGNLPIDTLRDHLEVARPVGIGMIHLMMTILVPQVPRPPLEEEGEVVVAMVMMMTQMTLEVLRSDVGRRVATDARLRPWR